jgi:Predicted pyridoxal phosphate-dependent enzyme apparently involved in regulation of cell wall biogenesis
MIEPNIRISPFLYTDLDLAREDLDQKESGKILEEHLGRSYSITASGRHALDLVLADASLDRNDVVTILTTTGGSYVSGCVTHAIGRLCHWSMRIEATTKLIVVIHEWGIPYPKLDELLTTGIPIVEDCAYSFASLQNGQPVGRKGKYAIFSLPKFFPINFGGLACGIKRKADLSHEHRRAILNVMGSQLPKSGAICESRIEAWRYLELRFREIGCVPALPLDQGTVPGVFMFKPHEDVVPEKIKQAYQTHGIEASVFYPWHAVYVPCHQRLTRGAMDYMVSVYEHARRAERDY